MDNADFDTYTYFDNYVSGQRDFTKKDLNKMNYLVRVPFCKDNELIFSAKESDFDFDTGHITHCVETRFDRFPEEIRNSVSKSELAEKLVKTVKEALKISKIDRFYIKPIYECKTNTISYVVPLKFLNADNELIARMGIVVSYKENFWRICTVLSDDMVRADVKVISPYANN